MIEQRLRFFYHWRAIDTALVLLIALNMIQNNQYYLIVLFSNHNHIYYFCIYLLSKQVEKWLNICHYEESSEDYDFDIIGELSIHRWYV